MYCDTAHMSISNLNMWKNIINDTPAYQRESGIWSRDKQQLFLDSVFNMYDVPKLYFHDVRTRKGKYDYAVIDGKQRLHCIWSFLKDEIPLADDFKIADPKGKPTKPIKPKSVFSKLHEDWRDYFKTRMLDVVLVTAEEEDEIEDLFSRLNNGEPLNAAESRNALGGEMNKLIREISETDFFTKKVKFNNKRYQHYEVAAKFLLIEMNMASGGDPFVDLKKKFLDKLVVTHKNMPLGERNALKKQVEVELKSLNRVFHNNDPLLTKQAYPPMYYLFVKEIVRDYADPKLHTKMRSFIEKFNVQRQENNTRPEEDRDVNLTEFGRLIQQGTNDKQSLAARVGILRRYFLLEHPEVEIRASKRAFNFEERLAIWVLGGKKCANCGVSLAELDDMDADHKKMWAHGGETTLKNARALCVPCNRGSSSKKRAKTRA
jgi:5-methylcytosine-specific restriction endonuclease McrA